MMPDYPIRIERLLPRPLDPEDRNDLLAYRSDPDVRRCVSFPPMDVLDVDRRREPMRREAHLVEAARFTGEWTGTLVHAVLDRERRAR